MSQEGNDASSRNGSVRLLDPQPTTSQTNDIQDHEADEESTPLLGRRSSDTEQNVPGNRPKRSWWTIISIAILLVITINIIVFAFVIPSAAQNYAVQATSYSLGNIEVQEYTENGVIAKAQVNVTVDADRVSTNGVRNLGIFATSIVKHVYTKPCVVSVLLPQYNGAQVALVDLPALTIDVRNRHINVLEIISNVTVTDEALVVRLMSDYLAGRRPEIQTIGETDVYIKAGIIPLGKHHMKQEIVIQGNAPSLPEYTISGLDVVDQPDEGTLMKANVEIVNPYPVTLDIPGMVWRIHVPGCSPTELIRLGNANTAPFSIRSGQNISVGISSLIASLPDELLDPCADGTPSPLEVLFQAIIDPKQNTTVFISGGHQTGSLPKWLPGILSGLRLPIPIPHVETNTTDLISSIRISEMKVSLPPPWAPPGSPNAQPKISGLVEAVIRPPKEAENVGINVTAVKADIYLFDKGKKFARIVVPQWSPATTIRKKKLHILARVAEVPVDVLDPVVFQQVMWKVLNGDEVVKIGVDGTVDGKVKVLVGEFAVRGIPVSGIVDVTGLSPYEDLNMGLVGDIDVLSTTTQSISLSSTVEVNNPTEYEAFVPYLNLELLYDGHLIGNATTVNATITNGTNKISGIVSYGPAPRDIVYGEKFLGEYLSGHSPNITVRFHSESFKGNPALSSAMDGFNITLPVPTIHDKDPESLEEGKHSSPFLRSATIHLLSRTAQFELFNPINNMGITLNSLGANATYNDEIIGTITEPDFDFTVLPGSQGYTTTDKVPVEVGTVGYDVIRRALGGELMVDAVADVVATIGNWRGRVRYYGQGLGASVRL